MCNSVVNWSESYISSFAVMAAKARFTFGINYLIKYFNSHPSAEHRRLFLSKQLINLFQSIFRSNLNIMKQWLNVKERYNYTV